ncbi:bacteriophage terminase large subunit [Candidatus Magnetoovum chiemensis]|nr:bacteriophage terminase large subunit [Candidatus Magnetoovum chiemensis]
MRAKQYKAEREILNDFKTYAASCLAIQPASGGRLAWFRLNEIQTLMEEIIKDIKRRDMLVRLIILKARREGISTWVMGRFYWKTATNFDRYAVLITHEPEATDFLFNMVKRFQRYVPSKFKPSELYNNKKNLELNNADGSGLDSAIRVGAAGKGDFGSGQLIHYLHLSEMAKWPSSKSSELLTSVLQCVPEEQDTEIIFESTAKGIGGVFYDRFFSARYSYELFQNENGAPDFRLSINEEASPDNVYSRIFIPWYVFSAYQISPKDAVLLTEDEALIKNLYGLRDSQILWRRWAIENRCGGSLDVFKQEYPSNAKEAFLSANRSVFDGQIIVALRENAPKPIAQYEISLSDGSWRAQNNGSLKVWENPIPGTRYIISADVAEGLHSGDYSCADVIVHLTGKQAAQWHGRISPDEFAKLLIELGKRYNNAWLAPERNNHGLMTVTRISDSKYPYLYAEMVLEPPSHSRKRYGWVTTSANKTLIIDNLIAEIRQQSHGIKCAATFDEMLTFIQTDDGKIGAQYGMNDDRVMSIAIAKFVRLKLPLPSSSVRDDGHSVHKSAWT